MTSEKTSIEDVFNLIIDDYNNIKNKFLQKPVYLITGYVGDVLINLDYDDGVYNKILNLPIGKFTEDVYISNKNKEAITEYHKQITTYFCKIFYLRKLFSRKSSKTLCVNIYSR